MTKSTSKKLIVILGPTASGKTELAIKLAKKFKGEIISADSRQIYKEMNIGTSKPTKQEMKTIPHHLVDVVKPNQDFNVAIFKKLALKKIKNIQKRKKIPLLVGGTGLYISSIVNNIDFPKIPANKKVREKLEKKTTEELFKIYKKLDPKGSKLIEKENKRRLIRAIEVCKATNKPYWQQRTKKEQPFDILEIGIRINKKELNNKISKRTEKMFKLGLEKEIKKLIKKYKWIPSLQTIGYQEWKDYFNKKINKEEVKDLINLHTIQFTKRQMTWFKRDKKINWINNYIQAQKLVRDFLN